MSNDTPQPEFRYFRTSSSFLGDFLWKVPPVGSGFLMINGKEDESICCLSDMMDDKTHEITAAEYEAAKNK